MGKSLKKQKKLWKYQVVTTTNSSSSLPSSSELCSSCSLLTGVQEAQLLNVLVLPYSCAHKYLAQLVEHISTQQSPLVCFSKRDLPTGSETWPSRASHARRRIEGRSRRSKGRRSRSTV